MEEWSNKYIGIKYNFGSNDIKNGTDCLRLVEQVLKNEKNFYVYEDGKEVNEDWYIQNPERLIREAVKRGEVITDISQLKKFDVVFFKIKGVVRHVGIMVNHYGKFIHQLEKRPSRKDDINARHWKNRFFCGIRLEFKNG